MSPNHPPLGTVLIVDDAPGNLALLSDALDEAGYRVLVATDGLSALEQLKHVQPDIILLDVMMPGIDGFETCRRLKSDSSTAPIPILFMTALSELDDLLRGFSEGAVDYIVKPIRHPEVLARVEAQLTQFRVLRRAEEALSRSNLAIIAIDARAAITWLTPAGRRWLAELSGMPQESAEERASTLPESLTEWALRSMRPDSKFRREPFTATRNGHKFSAQLIPCQGSQEYLLLLQDHCGDWDLDSLRAGLGLTTREMEILMWIARGKTNREVGQILGSSHRTVNKHLEHIFEKLGVVTRAAAVAVVLEQIRSQPGTSS
jgi:CheY-like chemotaxis protein/DNA-binding CsgD family transcriptional regulator